MKKMFIKIPPDFFKDLDFKITISPFGEKLCCCGYKDCINVDCLMHEIEHGGLSTKSTQ